LKATDCIEGAGMMATGSKPDSEEEYKMLREPMSCQGFEIQWQCDLHMVDSNTRQLKNWWVDYEKDFNFQLEVALMEKKHSVTLEGPAPRPDENWICDLVKCTQQNSNTGTLRYMRRLVVTKHG
jgi:hypothetical protein